MARYLTKSRFKLAMECPTKLYYTDKPDRYANQKTDDAFLQALAEGGYQVGELAKAYYPGGYTIETLDYDEAIRQTNELLSQDQAIIFEAAFRSRNLFVRADVVVKKGNELEIIEVKSKSNDSNGSDSMQNKAGKIASAWLPYVQDVAFQKYVVSQAWPDYVVYASLMTADKDTVCPTDGLNQKFRINKQGKRKFVIQTQPLTAEEFSHRILRKDPVDDLCAMVYEEAYELPDLPGVNVGFAELVEYLSDHYARNEKIRPEPKPDCKTCEFRTKETGDDQKLLSGFQECWREALNWQDDDFRDPTIFDIGRLHCTKKNKFFADGRIKLSDISSFDIPVKPSDSGKTGLSLSQRQHLQLEKAQAQDASCYIDRDNLKREMDSWVYPLHFIDFETAMAAIPFNKDLHPYEGIAFQFSHHVVYEDGRIEHKGQYLSAAPGFFPNFDFVRALKRELENDQGSIFRYSFHENTFLRQIRDQISSQNPELPDREELCRFIDSITEVPGLTSRLPKIRGPRNMIDLCELVSRFYDDPAMKGSTSIKKVLPSILNNSVYLQEKYSKPIYGASDGIKSLNYHGKVWVEFENDRVKDPYKLLRKLFNDLPDEEIELMSDDESINQGGAAAMAYYRMQSEDMSDYERRELQQSLLEYCELDTLAMVMLYEGWRDMMTRCQTPFSEVSKSFTI